eukprot:g6336.t1
MQRNSQFLREKGHMKAILIAIIRHHATLQNFGAKKEGDKSMEEAALRDTVLRRTFGMQDMKGRARGLLNWPAVLSSVKQRSDVKVSSNGQLYWCDDEHGSAIGGDKGKTQTPKDWRSQREARLATHRTKRLAQAQFKGEDKENKEDQKEEKESDILSLQNETQLHTEKKEEKQEERFSLQKEAQPRTEKKEKGSVETDAEKKELTVKLMKSRSKRQMRIAAMKHRREKLAQKEKNDTIEKERKSESIKVGEKKDSRSKRKLRIAAMKRRLKKENSVAVDDEVE